jgi:hypothetical protein
MHRATVVPFLLLALTACQTLSPRSCLPGQQAAVQEQIYLGTQTPTGHVTAEEWNQFLGESVTPRFPQGFTTWQASGQWRSESGSIVREPSYVLSLVHPAGTSDDVAIGELIATYKHRFQQEAVLQVRANVCMAL